VTLKTPLITSQFPNGLNRNGEPILSDGDEYWARFTDETVEYYDETIKTTAHGGVLLLEPDAEPKMNDRVTYGGRTYNIKEVKERLDARNEVYFWRLTIR